MELIYFQRSAESPIHIHAGSYASGFYVPQENIVLFSEQHGTFGGSTTSFTDRKELIDELKQALEGRIVKGTSYSNIKKFEAEDALVKGIIEDMRNRNSLDNKISKSLPELYKKVKDSGTEIDIQEQEEAPVEITREKPLEEQLDAATMQRLEAIVDRVEDGHQKFWMYRTLGNTAKADQYRNLVLRETIKHMEQIVNADGDTLESYIKSLETIGADKKVVDNFIKDAYNRARKEWKQLPGADCASLMLAAAKRLGMPEKTIAEYRENLLYARMVCRYSDSEERDEKIEKASKDIPPERIKAIAEKAYKDLMQDNVPITAGEYAVKYGLGRDKMLEAAKKWLETAEADPNDNMEDLQRMVDDFGLPEDGVRRMVRAAYIKRLTNPFGSMHSNYDHLAIVKKFKPSDDEMQKLAQHEYDEHVKDGLFHIAVQLRRQYPGLIKDSVAIEDLDLLNRIKNGWR